MTKSSIMLSRPESHEYPESYKNYVSLVPDGPVLDFLTRQISEYRQLLVGISDEAASADPEPGRWSLKQVLGHVCDTERVMSYRALRFARGDSQELRGFEQDDYVREAHSDSRTLDDLLAEFESVRQATIALFASLPRKLSTAAAWPTRRE
ncbi:MAG: DinB family protein [Acidobacteriota bacterium]|nr:DinB family protein [Acidobacteriota bacterium]